MGGQVAGWVGASQKAGSGWGRKASGSQVQEADGKDTSVRGRPCGRGVSCRGRQEVYRHCWYRCGHPGTVGEGRQTVGQVVGRQAGRGRCQAI